MPAFNVSSKSILRGEFMSISVIAMSHEKENAPLEWKIFSMSMEVIF
jgi:hypothetical protein